MTTESVYSGGCTCCSFGFGGKLIVNYGTLADAERSNQLLAAALKREAAERETLQSWLQPQQNRK